MAGIRHNLNHGAIAVLLHAPNGPVAKDMLRRGIRVQAQARRNLAGGGGKPRRIDTGQLRAGVYVLPLPGGGVRIGSRERHAMWVHDGTGIYGPRRRMIRSTRPGGYLRFAAKKGGGVVFVKQVRGMRPNPYLRDALSAAKY